jgi:hypothetical protein
MNYLVYSTATGQIMRNVSCVEPDAALQAGPGESLIAVVEHVDDSQYFVQDGAVTSMGEKPSPHHRFDFTTKQWVDPRTAEDEWVLVRFKRNKLMSACDWTQLPDVNASPDWTAYRQALRDITTQADPFAIVWPVAPG